MEQWLFLKSNGEVGRGDTRVLSVGDVIGDPPLKVSDRILDALERVAFPFPRLCLIEAKPDGSATCGGLLTTGQTQALLFRVAASAGEVLLEECSMLLPSKRKLKRAYAKALAATQGWVQTWDGESEIDLDPPSDEAFYEVDPEYCERYFRGTEEEEQLHDSLWPLLALDPSSQAFAAARQAVAMARSFAPDRLVELEERAHAEAQSALKR